MPSCGLRARVPFFAMTTLGLAPRNGSEGPSTRPKVLLEFIWFRVRMGVSVSAAVDFRYRTERKGESVNTTDGETRHSAAMVHVRGRRRTHVLAALFAALAFGILQLALAHNGSAATESSCPQTTMETVATDAADYPPGSTVHVTGTGYNSGCDVE